MNLYAAFVTRATQLICRRQISSIWLSGRRWYSTGIIKENDVVLLKHRSSTAAPTITKPLRAEQDGTRMYARLESGDRISHDDIIGKSYRECIQSKKRVLYRIQQPTLGEYTDFSPRLVTPIYSQDAALIVSLLDLHPTVPPVDHPANIADKDRLEIFEAGTGHGALTLHLAKAIHAANTPPPNPMGLTHNEGDGTEVDGKTKCDAGLEEWRKHRRAVIHTLDSSQKHSLHAEDVVLNFRHGLYRHNVDFHVGTISQHIASRLSDGEQRPFLDHVILDLSAAQDHLEIVAKALKPGGSLLVFCPSVTQVITCVQTAKEKGLALYLDKTVEVGQAAGVGGREWDIRAVKLRALLKAEPEIVAKSSVEKSNNEGWEMVCRPKVGGRIGGGGFVGLFRKTVEFTSRPGSVVKQDTVI